MYFFNASDVDIARIVDFNRLHYLQKYFYKLRKLPKFARRLNNYHGTTYKKVDNIQSNFLLITLNVLGAVLSLPVLSSTATVIKCKFNHRKMQEK